MLPSTLRNPFEHHRRRREETNETRIFAGLLSFPFGIAIIWGQLVDVMSLIFGFTLIVVGFALLAPKFFERKLAFLRKGIIVLLLSPWAILWTIIIIVAVPVRDPLTNRASAGVPGKAVFLRLGKIDVPAIQGMYRSSLSNCEFLPTEKQRTWDFDPIVSHRQPDTGTGRKWGEEDIVPALGTRPIDVTHEVVLSNREELWGTTLRFKLILMLTWPEYSSRTSYKTNSRLSSWPISISTYSKQDFQRLRINQPFMLFVGLFPLSFMVGSFVANRTLRALRH